MSALPHGAKFGCAKATFNWPAPTFESRTRKSSAVAHYDIDVSFFGAGSNRVVLTGLEWGTWHNGIRSVILTVRGEATPDMLRDLADDLLEIANTIETQGTDTIPQL